MRILVTGATGFIGRHLCRLLGGRHRVAGLARGSADVEGCAEVVAADLEILSGEGASDDLEETARRVTGLLGANPQAVVHLAARLAGPGQETDTDLLYANARMAESAARLARCWGSGQLVHLSTMAVYPNESGEYDEEARVWPASNTEGLYGLSKFCAENLLSRLLGEEAAVTHLRVAQVWGEGMREDRIIPVMKRELADENRITVFGNGERVSNFIRVERLTDIVSRFLDHPEAGVFNVGGEQLSYRELARRLIREHGNARSELRRMEDGSRARFRLNTDKLQRYLEGTS